MANKGWYQISESESIYLPSVIGVEVNCLNIWIERMGMKKIFRETDTQEEAQELADKIMAARSALDFGDEKKEDNPENRDKWRCCELFDCYTVFESSDGDRFCSTWCSKKWVADNRKDETECDCVGDDGSVVFRTDEGDFCVNCAGRTNRKG